MNNLGGGSARLPSCMHNDGGLRGYPGEMYGRRADAILLHRARRLGGCTSERKICILPHGGIDEWDENLYGFTRVVVHGEDSLCAVARTEDVERVIRQGKEVGRCISNMHNALIYEAEDLTLPCGGVGKMTSRRMEKPFVAVSVSQSTNSGHEASGAEYNVDSAIKFLKEKLDSSATSTFNGTLKTAIFTLDHLFGKTFKANEIEIFTVKKYRGRVMGLSRRGCRVTEYPIRVKRSIQDYLAVINKPCGKASSSRGRLVLYKPCSRGSSREKLRVNVLNKARKSSSLKGMDLKRTRPDLKSSDSSIRTITDSQPRDADAHDYCNDCSDDDDDDDNYCDAQPMQPFRAFATRDGRRAEAEFFINHCTTFHNDYPVIRACTSVRSRAERLWSDKWLGITWLALHGIDSICVVVRKNDLLNLTHKLCSRDKHAVDYFHRIFWNAIISNVEDIEDAMFGGNHKRPFSVVTVGLSKVHQRSGQDLRAKYCAKKTSKFLQDEMKSGATFTFEKTVETAISAFQHLFFREFKAHHLQVYVWKKDEIIGKELPQRCKILDREELLATVRA